MTVIGSLCSGAGALDLAVLEVLGGQVAWHADTDPAASLVLAHHWPGVPNIGDIVTADWSVVEPVDVLTCGYPCQPDSNAGLRKGVEDDRWIWPAVRDAVRELRPRPRLLVLENVGGHVGRGFPGVLGDLASIGYDARWCCVPASAVGAPHQRERLFVVAHPPDTFGAGLEVGGVEHHGPQRPAAERGGHEPAAYANGYPVRHQSDGLSRCRCATGVGLDSSTAPDPSGGGRERPLLAEPAGRAGRGATPAGGATEPRNWGRWASAIQRWERLTRPAPDPVELGRRGNRRLNPAFSEWMMGLPAGWVTAVPGLTRNDQLRVIGNGVVPQCASAALRWLLELDRTPDQVSSTERHRQPVGGGR